MIEFISLHTGLSIGLCIAHDTFFAFFTLCAVTLFFFFLAMIILYFRSRDYIIKSIMKRKKI